MNGAKAYTEVATPYEDITTGYMASKNIVVPPIMEELPSLYWLPRLHKNPYSSSFIAALNRCTTKPLSELLTTCLTTILTKFSEYCDGIYKINCFWIINNSQQVLNRVCNINLNSSAKCFDSYDFSTLYTSIPHNSLNYKYLLMRHLR